MNSDKKFKHTDQSIYYQMLRNAQYIFLATDSILSEGATELWLSISSGNFKQTIIVKPGLKQLQELPEYRNCNYAEDFNDHYDQNQTPFKIEGFFSSIILSQREDYPFKKISEMRSPKAEWGINNVLENNEDSVWENVSEKIAITQAVVEKYRSNYIVVISQDKPFLLSLRERCNICNSFSGRAKTLVTLSLKDSGDLFDPFSADSEDMRAFSASANLFSLVKSTPLFVEPSALKHPAADAFITNIKLPLSHFNKKVHILAESNTPIARQAILDRLQECAQYEWIDNTKSKTEAIIDYILESSEKNSYQHIAIITDRVPRAKRIQLQLDGVGILLDVYSINQYGYLSCRALADTSISKLRLKAEKKNIRAEWQEAIQMENLEKIQRLIANNAQVIDGMITSLLTGKSHILENILNTIKTIPIEFVSWWICEFRQFQQPTYLIEKPDFYRLLVKTLTLCPLNESMFDKLELHLDELSEKTNRSVEEIEYLNEMFNISADRDYGTSSPLRSYRLKSAYPLDQLPTTHSNEETVLEINKRVIEQKLQDIETQLSALEAQRTDLLIQLDNINTRLEFQWEETDSSTLNKAKLVEWLTRYKEEFAARWETEHYKWGAVCDFRSYWNLDEENLCAIVEFSLKTLGQNRRLLRPFGERMAYGMLHQFATHETENTRDLFRKLYDGINRENAEEHITRFLEEVTEMKERRRIDDMPNWRNHFQTKSTTSALLWVHAPQQFFYAEPRWAQACFNELELPYNGSGLRFQYTEVLENIGSLLRELKKRTYALKTMLAPYIKKLNVDADTAVAILVNDFAEFVGRECVRNRLTSL